MGTEGQGSLLESSTNASLWDSSGCSFIPLLFLHWLHEKKSQQKHILVPGKWSSLFSLNRPFYLAKAANKTDSMHQICGERKNLDIFSQQNLAEENSFGAL